MYRIYFSYNGKTVAGDIKTSFYKEPNFCWCYLNDPELIGELGQDCIFFVCNNGLFKTPHYYPARFRTLIGNVENAIREYLESMRMKETG